MSTTASRPVRETPEYVEAMAKIRASRLRAAGLTGEYARAECELGRAVYGMAKAGRGVYLHGPVGTGKTYAAACAVRKWLDGGGKARLVTAKKLLDQGRDGFKDGGDRHALERAERIPLLALDDVGLERPTEWAVEALCGLIDERAKRGLPTVFTSNYRLGELKKRLGGIDGERVASRIAGSCERIEVAGEDRRLACLR